MFASKRQKEEGKKSNMRGDNVMGGRVGGGGRVATDGEGEGKRERTESGQKDEWSSAVEESGLSWSMKRPAAARCRPK